MTLATNLGAIAFLAHQAKQQDRTLGVAEVPAWVLNPAVYVLVEPRKPPRDWGAPSEGRLPIVEVLEAEIAETADATFSESRWLVSQLPVRVGPEGRPQPVVFEKSRARGKFSIEAIKALPAGDLDLVVVTKDGERRCEIRARDRNRFARE